MKKYDEEGMEILSCEGLKKFDVDDPFKDLINSMRRRETIDSPSYLKDFEYTSMKTCGTEMTDHLYRMNLISEQIKRELDKEKREVIINICCDVLGVESIQLIDLKDILELHTDVERSYEKYILNGTPIVTFFPAKFTMRGSNLDYTQPYTIYRQLY